MGGASKFSDLIEEIYDAALEPALWNNVVVSINDFVGGRACGLISKDTTSQSGLTYYYCGVDPHYIQLYSDTHARYDHLTVLPPLGHVVSIPDLLRYDEYRQGPFYQEWLRPQGSVDIANVVLEKSSSNSAVLLAVLSGARMVDNQMRRRIALIGPHAHRALLINKAIDARQSEAATFAGTLDGLSAGIFLLDAGCRIVHANEAGNDILRADDFLRSVNGQLVARDVKVNQGLREIFAENGGISIGTRGIALPLTAHDGESYVAHLLPLTSAARRSTGVTYKAVAALFVRKAALDSPCGEVLARAFKLTPSELRVLAAVSRVGGVSAVAEALGISEATVKTHLQRLFAKTGTNRQPDLVKLVAAYASPLRRNS
jgi:DNA-binding CsgD family transcriptional regulator/PAS domain-containing protein